MSAAEEFARLLSLAQENDDRVLEEMRASLIRYVCPDCRGGEEPVWSEDDQCFYHRIGTLVIGRCRASAVRTWTPDWEEKL